MEFLIFIMLLMAVVLIKLNLATPTDIESSGDRFSSIIAATTDDHRLPGQALDKRKATDKLDCALCLVGNQFKSFNFNKATGDCYLNGKGAKDKELVPAKGFIYGEKNPCLSNPCNAPKLCKPSLDLQSYVCREGEWESWGEWVQCPCPQRRTRICRNPVTRGTVSDCPGPSQETKPCEIVTAFTITGCNSPLGMSDGSIPDSSITASSHYIWMSSCQPKHGRLHDTSPWAGWCARTNSKGGQHLQIDLGAIKTVTKVATQGRRNKGQWVTLYSLSYSNDTTTWSEYSGPGMMCNRKVFNGNIDSDSVVTNNIMVPFKARHIRVIPMGYKSWMSMRCELYGC